MTLTVKHPFTSAIADDPTAASAGQVLPSHWNANHTVTGSVDATQMPALTGDVTTSAGAVNTTLATVNSNVGTFGDATHVAQVTVNGKGLVTAASSVAISVSAAPAGSTTQVQFNDAGAFAGNAGLTFDKTTKSLTLDNNGQATGTTIFTAQNSSLTGSPGIDFKPNDGASYILIHQGNSGSGLTVRDFNNQPLLGIGVTGVSGVYWGIVGTGTSGNIGDLLTQDGLAGIGDATHNVKTIFQYTAALKPVAIASLPGSPTAGMLAAVNNALAPVIGATVSGTGSAFALVCYNGAAWKVVSI